MEAGGTSRRRDLSSVGEHKLCIQKVPSSVPTISRWKLGKLMPVRHHYWDELHPKALYDSFLCSWLGKATLAFTKLNKFKCMSLFSYLYISQRCEGKWAMQMKLQPLQILPCPHSNLRDLIGIVHREATLAIMRIRNLTFFKCRDGGPVALHNCCAPNSHQS